MPDSAAAAAKRLHVRHILIGLLLLAGCAELPETRQPAHELPAAWPQSQAQARIAPDWWRAYGDPVLDRLMEEALAHNRDLALAAARIEEARANLGLARADQFPSVELGAEAARSRMSERGVQPAPDGAVNNAYGVTLQMAYEVDLWGRYRQATKAARADLLASEYAREVVRLSLTGAVAQGYFALRALDAQVQLARDTLANRKEAAELQRRRVEAGIASELELRQAEAEMAAIEASLAEFTRQARQQENALAVLLGRSPRRLVEDGIARGQGLAELALPPAVPAGLPSELLARRPDLRQSEQRLAASEARIAEARAALYPNLSLTGYLGSESKALSNLFSGPATVWGLTAGLVQTVFNAGRTEAAVQAASARQEQALVAYEQALQQAFREVLDALVAHRQARELQEAESRRAEALGRALELAELRYKNGVSSYLEVLDAQRNLYSAQQNRIEARRSQLAAVTDLNKALGGGWAQP